MDVLTAPVKAPMVKALVIACGLLVLLLAGSIVANALLFNEWEAAKQRATAAETNLATANAQTEACNESVKGLEQAAHKRGLAAGVARERARQRAVDLEQQAQQELSTPATVPGDDCKSAQDRVRRILSERAKP